MSELPADAPKPRLCHIIKWPDFDGYGFNLHADKTRPGQYIGKVDEKSPADVAGLKEGDRIIEVNGVNILNENHKQVVQRIKNIANETKLLVVDGETDRWYKEKDLVVRGDQSNIVFGTSIKSAVEPATTNGEIKKIDEDDSRSINSAQSSHSEQSTQPQLQSPPNSAADRDEQQQQVEPVREIPVLVVDSDSSEEVTDSITDTYDNVIFSQEGERRDEDAPEPKEEVENKEMAASKIAVEDEAASALQRDCNEEIVGVKDCGNDAETKSEISIDLSSERSSSIHHDEDRPDSSIKSSLDEEPTPEPIPEPIPEPVHLVEKEDESEKKSLVEESIESSASSTPSPPPPAEPEIPTFIPEVVAITVPPPKVTSTATATATTDKTKSSMKNGGLNLNMTVAEMRAQLAAKKKFDPRKDTIDLKKKYQIIQNM